MRTLVQKQNQSQKPISSNVAWSHVTELGFHHAEELNAGLTDAASPHLGHDFSRIPIHPPTQGVIQTKLAINTPGDEYEQAADRVAQQVMCMPEPHRQLSQEHERFVGSSELGQLATPPIVSEVLASSGQPLDLATRAFFEPRFGYDFSQIRVHADAMAADSARALAAHAYTVGSHIVFGTAQFAPGTHEGWRLLAHELAHVTQPNATAVVRRDTVQNAAGNYVAYEFRVGHELTEAFMLHAKRLTANGTLSNSEIQKLKAESTRERGTVSDHERMFMAGLLDRANVRALQRTQINSRASITFALNTITAARMTQVIEAGRPALAATVSAPAQKMVRALAAGNIIEGNRQLGKLESAAEKEARRLVGTSFRQQMDAVIQFAQANNVMLNHMLLAMLKAASDDTHGDRLMAAAAFAVAAAVNHPLADDIRTGRIRIDALVPASFARLPGVPAIAVALYISAAPIRLAYAGLKGDTIYMKTDFDIGNLVDRSGVIHELEHARRDKAASPTQRPTFPAQLGVEEEAFRAQAKYILSQMYSQGAQDRARSATQTAAAGDLVLLAVLIEAKSDLSKYQPLVVQIFAAAPPPIRRSAADVARMLANPISGIEAVFRAEILRIYGIRATSQVMMEGQAGESLIHWIHRL